MEIKIARDLLLPIDAVTQTFAAIARKGAGKTYVATKMAEQMLDAGAQVVAIDPVGNWYGLRLNAAGTGPGASIYVFGGEHGDLPLTAEAGKRIAALVAEKRISLILDVSSFRKGERERFAYEFAEEFFHRKKSQRSPVHLFLEEAQKLVPQQAGPEERRMLGAFEDIVRLGRNYGIGCTLISQRPQSVNKEVLSQVECLITLQINGVHERKAIDAWVSEHGLDRGLLGELPGLHIGEAFIWSPSWLRTFKRIHIDKKRTFDASATPTVGQKLVTPGELSPMDIESLTKEMSVEVERAKADDPKVLRARITELERGKTNPTAIADAEQRGYERGARAGELFVETLSAASSKRNQGILRDAKAAVERLQSLIVVLETHETYLAEELPKARPVSAPTPAPVRRALPASNNGHGEKMGGAERKVLTVLAQYPQGRTKVQVALLAGYAHTGGGFNNALSALRSKGWMEGTGDGLRITDAGMAAVGSVDPLPSGEELRNYWRGQLGKAERAALEALIYAYPRTMTKDEIATHAGYEASGGGFNNALSRLRTLDLISGRGELRASEVLFE